MGRHFLQIPGPTNVPDRVLRAIAQPTIDHRGPEFARLTGEVLERLKGVFMTSGPVVCYPSSGTGAWEAALVNTLSPGDKVVAFETGHFSTLWCELAARLGLVVDVVPGDWRHAADPAALADRLTPDVAAVMVVHNETSTGVRSPVPDIREALDRAGHPALLLVDTISSLGSMEYRHDDWGVDVTVGCSQKGLMLPPGMSFTAVSEKAWNAAQSALNPRRYWDWRNMVENKRQVRFCGTAPIHFFYGLDASLTMIEEEGLENVFIRHRRLADAARACVNAWAAGGGPEVFPLDPAAASDSLTAVLMPKGHNAEDVRRIAESRFNVALGRGLGALDGRVFRIGHMGDLNEPTLLGALAAVEMALKMAKVPHGKGGLDAAMAVLAT